MEIINRVDYFMIILPTSEGYQRLARRSKGDSEISLDCTIINHKSETGFKSNYFKYIKAGNRWITEDNEENLQEFEVQREYKSGPEFEAFEQLSRLEVEALQ